MVEKPIENLEEKLVDHNNNLFEQLKKSETVSEQIIKSAARPEKPPPKDSRSDYSEDESSETDQKSAPNEIRVPPKNSPRNVTI